MKNPINQDVNSWYYNVDKYFIYDLVPIGPHKVLDLGCGTGKLGQKLKELRKADRLVGVEIFKPAADEALKYYDKVYYGDLEELHLNYNEYFDYVICGDILEHLRDPWGMLNKISKWLKVQGNLVCTIPNIRYWRVIRDLTIKGKWEYVDAGVLDMTHLRFFTRSSFLKMLEDEHFNIERYKMLFYSKKFIFLNRITLGLFEEFLSSQIVFEATKPYA